MHRHLFTLITDCLRELSYALGGGITSVLTGIGTPAAIAFGSIGLLTVITQGVLNRTAQIYTKKSQKHHDIQLAAQTILDGISLLISKAVEDGHISQNEYQKITRRKATLFSN